MKNASAVRARAAPVMVLCRQCVRYVYAGTRLCPLCGGDAREIGAAYQAGGYLAVETVQQIDRLREAADDRNAGNP